MTYRNATYPSFSSRPTNDLSRTVTSHAVPSSGVAIAANDLSHNLYNLNLNRTACYNSRDELKTGERRHPDPPLDPYSTYPQAHQYYQHSAPVNSRNLPRSASFDSRGGGSVENEVHGYSHPQHQHGAERWAHDVDSSSSSSGVLIGELTPSRFGSKRESHSDRRDSPFYNAHLPVHEYDHAHVYGDASVAHAQQLHSRMQVSNSMPYMDSSHSSQASSASSNHFRYNSHRSTTDTTSLRQQNPPLTPQFESPPVAVLRHDSPKLSRAATSAHAYAAARERGAVSPLLSSMTVTKYSNFVETSKPFEMADFYKYSEKIRKTRGELGDSNGRCSPAHSSASEHSSNRAPSPVVTSARLQQQHVMTSRSRSGSPLTINMQQQQSSQHKQHMRAQHGTGSSGRMRTTHSQLTHPGGDNSRLYAQHPSPASSPHVEASPYNLHSHNAPTTPQHPIT